MLKCKLNILLAILMLSFVNCYSQSYYLNFNLEKGNQYRLKQDVEQITSQTVMGAVQTVETSVSSIMVFDIKEKTKEFLLIDVAISDMVLKMISPMFSIEFNSNKEVREGDIMGKIYSKVIGKKYSVLVSRNGEVKQVEGLDGLINTIIEESNLENPQSKAQISQSVKKMFGESVIKGNMEMLTYFFPKKNVNIGDKWRNKISLESAMPVVFNNYWELKGVELGVASIVGNTEITSKVNKEWTDINGIPTKYDISGKQNCIINIDKKTGWILSSEIESIMEGNIIMNKSVRMPKKMEIPVEIKTKTKYKSIN